MKIIHSDGFTTDELKSFKVNFIQNKNDIFECACSMLNKSPYYYFEDVNILVEIKFKKTKAKLSALQSLF